MRSQDLSAKVWGSNENQNPGMEVARIFRDIHKACRPLLWLRREGSALIYA
jgi:hypothetical protein